MQIHVNGERRELKDESQLSDLLQELSLAPERVAVELNHEVVRRNDWPNTILKEGDRVEIVHFVGGGEQEAESRRQKAEGRKQKAESRRQKAEGRKQKAVIGWSFLFLLASV